MSAAPEIKVAFSPIACISVFALESIYILFAYNPVITSVQVGLMAIFAVEAGYMVKIAEANLREKRATGRISHISRFYTAGIGLPLLAMIAVASATPKIQQWSILWLALFFVLACAKVAWYRHFSRLEIA